MTTHTVPGSDVTFTSPPGPDEKSQLFHFQHENAPEADYSRVRAFYDYLAARLTSMGHESEVRDMGKGSFMLLVEGEVPNLKVNLAYHKGSRFGRDATMGLDLEVSWEGRSGKTQRYPEGSKNGISIEKLVERLAAYPGHMRRQREGERLIKQKNARLAEAVEKLVAPLRAVQMTTHGSAKVVTAYEMEGDGFRYGMNLRHLTQEQAEAVVAALRATGASYEEPQR